MSFYIKLDIDESEDSWGVKLMCWLFGWAGGLGCPVWEDE